MISRCGSPPLALAATAASMMARACISVISGKVMPRRHPRNPSMGFCSCSSSTRASSVRSSLSLGERGLVSSRRVISTSRSSRLGRNSCSGGSSRRMVTGSDSMALKRPAKSARCMGRSFLSAARRSFSLSARIMARMCSMRSSAKNMCSVRQRPMPSAPKARAFLASRGMSALARTCRRRTGSTQLMNLTRSWSSGCASRVLSLPAMTRPVVPSSEI